MPKNNPKSERAVIAAQMVAAHYSAPFPPAAEMEHF